MTYYLLSTHNPRFPYALVVKDNSKTYLNLMVQDRWPGAGKSIFCVRRQTNTLKPEEVVEKVPVVNLKQNGKRLEITLGRHTRKRCFFLFLTKTYKKKAGTYEQIFWQSYSSLHTHRPTKLISQTHLSSKTPTIYIDTKERYPLKFSGCEVQKETLAVGDYAIKDQTGLVAVVERKNADDFVKSLFTNLARFQSVLTQLKTYPYKAVIIEAHYTDFLKKTRWSQAPAGQIVARIAQLQTEHPEIPFVFVGSRKAAEIWVKSFFIAVNNRSSQSASLYEHTPNVDVEQLIKQTVFHKLPKEFRFRDVQALLPSIGRNTIKYYLDKLRNEGEIILEGRGPKAHYLKL